MKERKYIYLMQGLFIILCGIAMLFGSVRIAIADVNAGDTIDKSNWQKLQGLLPEAIVGLVQKGYMTIQVGKLNYDPDIVNDEEYRASMKTNLGKYGITPKGELIDKKTGEIDPIDVIGIPFPNIDPKDPYAGLQMDYNRMYNVFGIGGQLQSTKLFYIGQKMERYVQGPGLSLSLMGNKRNLALRSHAKAFGPKISSMLIMKVTDPYELNGLATMLWDYNDNTPNKTFAYVPALRRTRVLPTSSRSDAMHGTDWAIDDVGGMMGKPRDFNCKYLRSQEALVQFIGPDIMPLIQNADGSYGFKKPFKATKWGFETPGWQGKAWAPTNHIWVKRPNVHVIECTAKDPYYNYGKFELWYDQQLLNFTHKVVWDRAGKRWKVLATSLGAYQSPDRLIYKVDCAFGDWIYDEIRDHATGIEAFNPAYKQIFRIQPSLETFTMGGLVEFAK